MEALPTHSCAQLPSVSVRPVCLSRPCLPPPLQKAEPSGLSRGQPWPGPTPPGISSTLWASSVHTFRCVSTYSELSGPWAVCHVLSCPYSLLTANCLRKGSWSPRSTPLYPATPELSMSLGSPQLLPTQSRRPRREADSYPGSGRAGCPEGASAQGHHRAVAAGQGSGILRKETMMAGQSLPSLLSLRALLCGIS